MPFYERLLGYMDIPTQIPIHQFMASLGEMERGKVTRQSIIDHFQLDPTEAAEVDVLSARIKPSLDAISLGAFVSLPNVGTAYDAIDPAKGLGRTLLQTTGISRVQVDVFYRKVGTGTVTFQLWNETDGVELASVSDGAGASERTLTMDWRPNPVLGKGQKVWRVRVRSTNAADDPSYYGSTLLIERVGILTSEVLHEVLLLGAVQFPGLDSVAAVKARLGV